MAPLSAFPDSLFVRLNLYCLPWLHAVECYALVHKFCRNPTKHCFA